MHRYQRNFRDVARSRAHVSRILLGGFALMGLIPGCGAQSDAEATARQSQALSSTSETNSEPSAAANASPSVTANPTPSAAASSVPKKYIVKFKKGAAQRGVTGRTAVDVGATLAHKHGAKVRHHFQHALEGMAVELPANAVTALKSDPEVEYVVEDGPVTLHDVTWGKDRIDQRPLPLNQTFNAPNHGEGVHVYVIDSGIRSTHTEFFGGPGGASRIGLGTDVYNNDSIPEDELGHGTHVAATIGGTQYGVANQVTLHPVKVFGTSGSDFSVILAGVDWVTARHNENPTVPAVANMSLGGGFNQALNDAVQNSIATGITYVISAGNDGLGPSSYANACNVSPASVANAITVGATQLYDARRDTSNYGPCIDVFAPGERVLSAYYTSDTGSVRFSGTSMAAPHVTGTAALYLSANPTATPAQVSTALVTKSTRGVLSNIPANTPNRLLYMGNLTSTGGDAQVPTVQITSPAANSVVTGLPTITATAADNIGVTGVELYVNGAFESDDSNAPYALAWDTRPRPNGTYDLEVRAYDNAGNVGSSTVRVQLVQDANPPAVSITAPASGGSVGALTTLRASATDLTGIRLVTFMVDMVEVGRAITPVNGSTYEASWDSRTVTPGTHTATAIAMDGTGVQAVSPGVSFTVYTDMVAPTATITAPASGATVSGTVSYTATASDDHNVIKEVDFLVGDIVVCTDTTAPYTCSWNTKPEGNGQATLRVKAIDWFGNVGVSAARTVTVQGSPAATYNTTFAAPACTTAGASCSSRRLTAGQLSTETHASNTLGGTCADGPSLGRYHFDESIDRLYVATVDGTNFAAGKQVTVEVDAYILGDADYVDLYHAPNANAPVWTYLTTLHRTGAVHDTVPLTAQFTLPTGGSTLQAIRANLRTFSDQGTCTPGSWNDHDDLVFAVTGGGSGPCAGACSNPITFSTASYNSGNLGTAATCHETTASPTAVNCGNFAAGRTFTVNGQLVTCNNQNVSLSSIAKRNGGYCLQASAGNYSYAYFTTF